MSSVHRIVVFCVQLIFFCIHHSGGIKISELLRIYTKGKYDMLNPDSDPGDFIAAFNKRNGQNFFDGLRGEHDVSIVAEKREWPFKPNKPSWISDNKIPESNRATSYFRYQPRVRVMIDGTSNTQGTYSVMGVTYRPGMTVFESIVMAAVNFHRIHRFQTNPFNVELLWDDRKRCEIISSAFNIDNTEQHSWKIVVRRRRGKRIYKNACIPSTRLRLRPWTRVNIIYE